MHESPPVYFMPFRNRLLSLLAALLAVSSPLRAENADGSTQTAGNAEAVRLYAEANAFVKNMAEGQYSYGYLQFYWKRAQANLDRIKRVYADSPTARSLAAGDLKVGPYELGYFRERVLYNLELKQLGSFDDVNCAIFLYGLDPGRNDALRDGALADIIEVLSRRQRWGEALRFPVLDAHKPLLWGTIFRVAAYYDQASMVRKLTEGASPALRKAAGFNATQAEAQALLGKPREELYAFVDKNPEEAVREAALRGMVERSILIRRMEGHHLPPGQAIQTVHLAVQNLAVRDDVRAAAARIFRDNPSGASPQLAVYSASLGVAPDADARPEAHEAFLRFLADARRLDEVGAYGLDLPAESRRACRLKAVELLAEGARTQRAEAIREELSALGPQEANAAALAEFRGLMDSTEAPLVAREGTFAQLPITDPCIMATAIMEWSLTPNRSQRGATPWDAVVFKFAGGFTNLPKPKSAAVSDAASTVKPY